MVGFCNFLNLFIVSWVFVAMLGLSLVVANGGYSSLQYMSLLQWASLMAQVVKNPPAMQETWVRSLGWEDPLEKGKATHCSILAWRIPWTV